MHAHADIRRHMHTCISHYTIHFTHTYKHMYIQIHTYVYTYTHALSYLHYMLYYTTLHYTTLHYTYTMYAHKHMHIHAYILLIPSISLMNIATIITKLSVSALLLGRSILYRRLNLMMLQFRRATLRNL